MVTYYRSMTPNSTIAITQLLVFWTIIPTSQKATQCVWLFLNLSLGCLLYQDLVTMAALTFQL